jgi:hypothetical protein
MGLGPTLRALVAPAAICRRLRACPDGKRSLLLQLPQLPIEPHRGRLGPERILHTVRQPAQTATLVENDLHIGHPKLGEAVVRPRFVSCVTTVAAIPHPFHQPPKRQR